MANFRAASETQSKSATHVSATRVLVVEDEQLFRDLLSSVLSDHERFQMVAAVDNGDDALRVAEREAPDVVLMDIELGPGPDGIKTAHRIKAADPMVGIVILSMHRDKQYLASLPENRAAGWSYMLKQNIRDHSALIRAIEGSARGMVTMDPAITEELRPRRKSRLEKLTGPQVAVLEKLAAGYTNEATAAQLGMGVAEVEDALGRAYAELGLEDDLAAVDRRVRAVLLYLQETSSGRGT